MWVGRARVVILCGNENVIVDGKREWNALIATVSMKDVGGLDLRSGSRKYGTCNAEED